MNTTEQTNAHTETFSQTLRSQLTAIWCDVRPFLSPPWLRFPQFSLGQPATCFAPSNSGFCQSTNGLNASDGSFCQSTNGLNASDGSFCQPTNGLAPSDGSFCQPTNGLAPSNGSFPLRVQESPSTVYRSRSSILQVYSLGEATLRCNGRPIEERLWHTNKNKLLFFCLLSHPHGVSEDTLLEEFWPKSWESGKQSLYAATSKLRRLFRSISGSQRRFIVRRQGRLMWEDSLPLWYDLHEVRRQAQATHSASALAAHQRLSELGRGPFLPECGHSWAQTVRTEVELLLQRSLSFLSRHYIDTRQNEEALEYAQRLLRQFPLEQQGCELAMRACLNLGHCSRALEFYRAFCSDLRRELNAEPTLELITLYQQARMGVTG